MLKKFGVIVAAFALCAAACATHRGDEHFKIDSQSPEQYLSATRFVHDCGAFADSVSHVDLRDKG